jgi:hypothetical protein
MSKKESYKEPLLDLIEEALKTGNPENLTKYLITNSNLPGPRGNLELAEAFADAVKDSVSKEPEKLWNLSMKLTLLSPAEAPVNDPKEFLVFCGVRGVGILGASSTFFQGALSRLKELASDPRWRVREGVAAAIQSMIEKQPQKTLKALYSWVENGNWFVMRAVAAGVAEPALLKDNQTTRSALEVHKKIFAKIGASRERKVDEFKTLRQGLGYSLSVVVCAIPKEGFELIRQLAGTQDADILWIVKENLKKNRLIKNFPDEVTEIKGILN